jgi:gag-polypeptide of LTR copia-type
MFVGPKSTAEIWLAIKNVFQRTSLLNQLAARRPFYTVSMADGEKILTYINLRQAVDGGT